MNFDDALRRYRQDRFSDSDIEQCTGLSVRAWRELIKLRAVYTTTENLGRGRVRTCDRTVFKRATVIAALNRAGFSLAVAGQIAYFFPFHTVLYEICDPNTILFQASAKVDPTTGLPPRVEKPKTNWFDPKKPARTDPRSDWLIEIYDARFVGGIYNANGPSLIFGDLRNDGRNFVAWLPLRQRPRFNRTTEQIVKALHYHQFASVADWEDPPKFPKELKELGYKYEKHATDEDPVCRAAKAIKGDPLLKASINVSLAIRKALRRYLGLEPLLPDSELGEPT